MVGLSKHLSLRPFAFVLGWLLLLTALAVVYRNSSAIAWFVAAIFITWCVLALAQAIDSYSFRELLRARAPDVLGRRKIGSLFWGPNTRRLIGATQDAVVLQDPILGPPARRLAAWYFAMLAWFMTLWITACVTLLVIGLLNSDALAVFASAVLFVFMVPGMTLEYLAVRGPRGDASPVEQRHRADGAR